MANSKEHEQAGHDHHHHDHHHNGLRHVHAPANFGKAFAIGVSLNAAFVVLEVVFGITSNSVALLADAGHNVSDALGLGVAWAAVILGKRRPTRRFTYGLGGTSILAALFNAIFLLVVVGGLSWEAIQRFSQPEPVAGKTVMAVAACGILINGFCAWLFASGSKEDLNVRGAFMHMAADAIVSLGVVIAGLAILLTDWHWIDPLVSLIVNAVIIWGTWSLLRGSVEMSLNAVPQGIDPGKVRAFLAGLPGVAGLHDLHIWPVTTTDTALTCHLVMPSSYPGDEFLMSAAAELKEHYKIGHVTLQVETNPDTRCALEPEHVV